MAAAIAHEVKNPLAGIEVMAGLLKRQLADSEDAQSILGDIIKEAKMANAIVLEVLDFVRPIRLQVERISVTDAIRDAVSMAESHVPRGNVDVSVKFGEQLPAIQGDPHQLRQIFTNLLTNAFEALGGEGAVAIFALDAQRDGPAGGEPQGPDGAGGRHRTTVRACRPTSSTRSSARSSRPSPGLGAGAGDCQEDRGAAHRRRIDVAFSKRAGPGFASPCR
jgi:light-regulated signal transduction histidine kinase (bacteriophytochrome)